MSKVELVWTSVVLMLGVDPGSPGGQPSVTTAQSGHDLYMYCVRQFAFARACSILRVSRFCTGLDVDKFVAEILTALHYSAQVFVVFFAPYS